MTFQDHNSTHNHNVMNNQFTTTKRQMWEIPALRAPDRTMHNVTTRDADRILTNENDAHNLRLQKGHQVREPLTGPHLTSRHPCGYYETAPTLNAKMR